jgi:hypothetical protein
LRIGSHRTRAGLSSWGARFGRIGGGGGRGSSRRELGWNRRGWEIAYTRELDTTITTFRRRAFLLDVEVTKGAAGGFDDTDFVGAGVVAVGIGRVSVWKAREDANSNSLSA